MSFGSRSRIASPFSFVFVVETESLPESDNVVYKENGTEVFFVVMVVAVICINDLPEILSNVVD